MPSLWSVAVDAPLPEPLTYNATSEQEPLLAPGTKVTVPLGRRNVDGVILGSLGSPDKLNEATNQTTAAPKFKIKDILEVDQSYSPVPKIYLEWSQWLSQYYLHPIGEVTQTLFPPLKKGNPKRKSKKAPVLPEVGELAPVPTLMAEQESIVKKISAAEGFQVHLLFGVTGSGKTEVYLEVLEKTLALGKSGLVLVPEISLTPQLIQRFSKRFGQKIAVLHSHLTEREKTDQWWSIVSKEKSILIGARSALFCPMENLGLIIIDEEHEPSFKQEEKLKYHARDAAVVLASKMNCPVILGSATPSLETWQNAQSGRYHLHRLKQRYREVPLPTIQVVDLREAPKCPDASWMSQILYTKIRDTLERGRQAALFLNRRGTAPVVICQACGKVYECSNCDISLTLHHGKDLICHYCNYYESYSTTCRQCHERKVYPIGLGTEQVEKDLRLLFPNAVVARADRDEIQNREDLETLIREMEEGKTQILVGTQMIAKGLDFPKLDLVGFVFADVGFSIPDFRSVERSFQLLTQMSGRAGRHARNEEERGLVLLQTLNPEHPCLKHVLQADFVGLAEEELQARSELNLPPFGRLACVKISANELESCLTFSTHLRQRMLQLKDRPNYQEIEVLGPSPAPIEKLRGKFRFHALIKGRENRTLHAYVQQLMGQGLVVPNKVRVSIDIDPLHLL